MNPLLTSEKNPSLPNKSSQKKRGKINMAACDKCKHDKKKCDGNFLTRKACKYCRNHNQDCIYSEPNPLRISRILNAATKNASEERDDDPMQEIQKQLTIYENTIIELKYQLENKNEQSNVLIEKLYLSLFASPQISNEQTIVLKKLCEMTNNPTNLNTDGENIDEIKNKLLIIASDDRTDIEKRHSWEELDKFVKMYNDNLSYNNIDIPSDDLSTSNIFGFTYPSGSTTPFPSPQSTNGSNAINNANMYVTNNHVITNKKRKNYEPYPSGGRTAIRPSRKESNVMVLHQSNPREDIPMIAVHTPQNNHSTKSTDSNETFQNSSVQFNNISSNKDFPFSTSNLVFSSHMPYEFDEVGSSNSTSDDNLEFPTFFSHPSVEDLLEIFTLSQ